MRRYLIVYSLTFVRIPLAVVFIICFQPKIHLLVASCVILAASHISDILDGIFARKFGIASIDGLLWDSLADKAMYIASVIAMNTYGLINPLISWSLLFSEVFLYVDRLVRYNKLQNLQRLKFFSRLYGLAAQIMLLSGITNMFEIALYGVSRFEFLTMSLAIVTLLFRVISILAHHLTK